MKVALLIAIAVWLPACQRSGPKPITVGSKNFTEQVVLGQIVAQHLERRLGERVELRLNLGGTLLAHQALLSGDIDVYPEYSGTALTAILKAPLESDLSIVRERVRSEYSSQFRLRWLKPLGFDNSFAMAVRGEDARKLGLETLSDAAGKKTDWRLGVGYEFQQRPDGLPALMKTYELRLKAAPQSMDLGLLYKALIDRQVDMIAANGTDGLLSTLDVKVLRDDRSAFPPYEAALVMREDPNRPTLPAVLEELSGKFTDETMRKLNYEVDGKHRRVEAVAAEFLQQAGLR